MRRQKCTVRSRRCDEPPDSALQSTLVLTPKKTNKLAIYRQYDSLGHPNAIPPYHHKTTTHPTTTKRRQYTNRFVPVPILLHNVAAADMSTYCSIATSPLLPRRSACCCFVRFLLRRRVKTLQAPPRLRSPRRFRPDRIKQTRNPHAVSILGTSNWHPI